MVAYPLILRVPCANTEVVIDGKLSPCPKPAPNVCKGCFLVQYCSRECQSCHWKLHKVDCKSPLMKATWRPSWAVEERQPSFINDDGPMLVGLTSHGKQKYLWGNVPAFDALNHDHNEVNLPQDLHLLFAASGDIRNVARSVVGIPSTYSGACEVVINDRDFDIVARNIILLLMALHLGPDEATPIMLHIWYSALVPIKMVSSLQSNIAPLIRDVCAKIREKRADSLQGKTWKYGTQSLRVVLQKSQWESLLSYFEVPNGLSTTQAQNIRTSTTLAPERRDYVDRALYLQSPSWRVSMMKFRNDGILLPFGASRKEFDTPNPTLYQTSDSWPMMDSADPLQGWPASSVIEKAPLAKSDIYGSLFLYVQELLVDFCQKIHILDVHFQLFHLNATDLPSILEGSSMNKRYFDRIEVSNIADRAYLGPATTLATFGPMLKPKSENPHAAMVTLFLNAVHEATTDADHLSTAIPEIDKLRRYLLVTPAMFQDRNTFNPDVLRLNDARVHFRDFDKFFERYMRSYRFNEIGKAAGLEMKSKNTIIEPWPMRLSNNPSQKEFDISLASGHMGSERYVEWNSLA